MYKKVLSIIFIVIFNLMISLPLLFTNLKPNVISKDENRKLTQKPELYNKDGSFNKKYLSDLEKWFNDNVGFRSNFVLTNAKIQYYVFNVLSNNSNMILGPNGEINYATDDIITDYAHLNMWSEEQLVSITNSYKKIDKFLKSKNIQFYYFQCWDKHTIYPEYFPKTIVQYGTKSRTDQRIERMLKDTDVTIISPKEELVKNKNKYEVYSKYGDATHWTERGAYIGYQVLMNEINKLNSNRYYILKENDYDIKLVDSGSTLFGGIHLKNYSEKFNIKNPKAVLANDKLTLYADDQRHDFYTNDTVDNKTRILIIGDSYFDNYIIDDIAESFYETIIIRGDYLENFSNIIEEYKPDIVILECAERADKSYLVALGARNLNVD